MSPSTTVIFADLTGSTTVFEKLGNELATRTITSLTRWICKVCEKHGGRVVKTLGDGVLALFPSASGAIAAAVELQREHARQQARRGPLHTMQLQVGMACGEIVEVAGDCFGDAVNVASRLSDLSGAREIWATDTVIEQIEAPPPGTRFYSLGQVPIRGKAQERLVFRIEWQEDATSDLMTLPGFAGELPQGVKTTPRGVIDLQYLEQMREFNAEELPIHLGRSNSAEFPVADARVSRLHARIDWGNQGFVLVDLSSFGTCVRFRGGGVEVKLRRNDCVLHGSGEIALGPNFGDFSVPTIQFALALRK